MGEAKFPSSALSPWVQTRKRPQEEQEGTISGPGTAGEQVLVATWAGIDLPSHFSCWDRGLPSGSDFTSLGRGGGAPVPMREAYSVSPSSSSSDLVWQKHTQAGAGGDHHRSRFSATGT